MPRPRTGGRQREATPEQLLELVFAWGGQCVCPVVEVGEQLACDGIDCWSSFDSDEGREAAWWRHRDELLSTNAGTRPPGWWAYEAIGTCRHRPRCTVPPMHDSAAGRRWLEEHDLLLARERSTLARAAGMVYDDNEKIQPTKENDDDDE